MKITIFLCFFLAFSFTSNAQSFELPENLSLKKVEDYKTHEKTVVDAIQWLMDTPVGSEQIKRKEVNGFVMQWITGSPSVSIELNSDVITFMDCADCLMMFLGGWTQTAIESDVKISKAEGNIAGVRNVIAFYKKNKEALGKNKAVEKFIKRDRKGTLEKYIRSNI